MPVFITKWTLPIFTGSCVSGVTCFGVFAALGLSVIPVLAAQTQVPPSGLKIVVVEGDGAINNIGEHRAKAPVVRVTDQTGAPVRDASVTFLLPRIGPSGLFGASGRTMTVLTDEDGMATGRGLVPNQDAGKFEIRVVASQGGQTARAVVTQTNAEPAVAAHKSSKKFLWIALIGGAAAGGALAAMGHGGSSTSSSQASPSSLSGAVIVPGAPVFQPPH